VRRLAQLDELASGLTSILGDDLVGVYLHGSLVLDCFNPQHSDVDVIAVTTRPTTARERAGLRELVLRCSGPMERPRTPPYPLEISLLTQAKLRPWRHPAPFDFHYGESLRTRFEAGDFEPRSPVDPDLAAHLTVLREAGIVLHGPPVAKVFPAVPEEDYVDSLLRDLEWDVEQLLYAVLSGSRVWATITERRLHSKLSGGLWAIERTPARFRPLVVRAVEVYRGDREDDDFNKAEVDAFRSYLRPLARSIASRYACS
jgi:hypothetical protein